MLLLFVRAYSLGGGTYTGIEAVSNGLPIMREPRVQTAKRTMVYMAISLAFTAGGHPGLLPAAGTSRPVPGKTMNAVLVEQHDRRICRCGAAAGRSSRWSPRACCWSSPRRPASSTARA